MQLTDLFAAYQAADAAVDAAVAYDAKVWKAADVASAAYFAAVAAKTAKWNALPECDAKCSAEENANDTVYVELAGSPEDRLFWLQIAIGSYDDITNA
jgi:hypothetical protein